jgi:predicted DNA-binding transcriptional regulator AlpA
MVPLMATIKGCLNLRCEHVHMKKDNLTAIHDEPDQQINIAGPKPGALDDTIYTTDEVAAWLRIKKGTLEKARSTGKGNYPPFIRLGGRRIGYRHIDIINWIQQNLHLMTANPA